MRGPSFEVRARAATPIEYSSSDCRVYCLKTSDWYAQKATAPSVGRLVIWRKSLRIANLRTLIMTGAAQTSLDYTYLSYFDLYGNPTKIQVSHTEILTYMIPSHTKYSHQSTPSQSNIHSHDFHHRRTLLPLYRSHRPHQRPSQPHYRDRNAYLDPPIPLLKKKSILSSSIQSIVSPLFTSFRSARPTRSMCPITPRFPYRT